MRFPFQFTRRIGGTGAVPVLGSDVAPVDRGDLTDSNVFKTSVPSGIAVQRLAVAYSYTGAGVPVALSAKVYLYDGTTERWYTTDANDITLKPGDISYVSISQIIGKSQVVGGDPYVSTANSLEIALVVAASGTDPDGSYAFPMGLDLGDVADEDALLPVVATAAKQDDILAALADSQPRNVAAYHNACTAKADGPRTTLESDREGNLHVSAVCSHSRVLALPTTGAWTGTAVLPEGAFDAVEAETDDVYVFGQQREAVRLASILPADWTAGAGWTFAGTVATHAAGGGVATLELPVHATYPIQLGVPYCVEYSVTMSAGTVTEKLGTAGSAARAATGKFVQVLVPTISGVLSFTPTNDSDAAIDIANVWVYPHTYLPNKGAIKPCSFTRIAACSVKSAPATMTASPTTHIVKAHWYRRTV